MPPPTPTASTVPLAANDNEDLQAHTAEEDEDVIAHMAEDDGKDVIAHTAEDNEEVPPPTPPTVLPNAATLTQVEDTSTTQFAKPPYYKSFSFQWDGRNDCYSVSEENFNMYSR